MFHRLNPDQTDDKGHHTPKGTRIEVDKSYNPLCSDALNLQVSTYNMPIVSSLYVIHKEGQERICRLLSQKSSSGRNFY